MGILKHTGEKFDPQVTHGATFISTQWEHIGNGLIGDDAAGSERRAVDYNTRWIQTEFTWDPAYAMPGTKPEAILNLRQCYQVVYDGIREPGQWQPGSIGIFNIRFPRKAG